MTNEKPAPTAAEIAEARGFFVDAELESFSDVGFPDTARHIRTLLAALDAAEAERKDAIGALDDAGVRCNPDDDLATRVEKLAKDRDEIARLWAGVCDLLWPNREPDDAFGVDDVRESVKELRESLDAAEARADTAEKSLDIVRARWVEADRRANDNAERCENMRAEWVPWTKKLATAERERDDANRRATAAEKSIDRARKFIDAHGLAGGLGGHYSLREVIKYQMERAETAERAKAVAQEALNEIVMSVDETGFMSRRTANAVAAAKELTSG